MKREIEYLALRGEEIKLYLEEMSRLRIVIFREWPYLYDGNLEMEKEYLKMYENSLNTLWVMAREKEQIIGAITGVPLKNTMDEVWKPFEKKGLNISNKYYLGEILLLSPYRGHKIGLNMYEMFESKVRKLGKYSSIVLCEIVRDKEDPRKPSNYYSLDKFWDKQGYHILKNITATFSYNEIQKKEKVSHLMAFREKKLK